MSRETRKTQIIHLLGNPSLSHQQIADLVGVSSKTVMRAAKGIKPDMSPVDAKLKLKRYQTLLHKRLPISKRVEALVEIAGKKQNPFVRLRALERADDLDGILTAKDEIHRQTESSPDSRPLFVLPGDARVQINIDQRIQSGSETNITPNTEDRSDVSEQ